MCFSSDENGHTRSTAAALRSRPYSTPVWETAASRRPSAGTWSPLASSTTSPTTSSVWEMTCALPSRSTLTVTLSLMRLRLLARELVGPVKLGGGAHLAGREAPGGVAAKLAQRVIGTCQVELHGTPSPSLRARRRGCDDGGRGTCRDVTARPACPRPRRGARRDGPCGDGRANRPRTTKDPHAAHATQGSRTQARLHARHGASQSGRPRWAPQP